MASFLSMKYYMLSDCEWFPLIKTVRFRERCDITSEKMVMSIATAMRTSNFKYSSFLSVAIVKLLGINIRFYAPPSSKVLNLYICIIHLVQRWHRWLHICLHFTNYSGSVFQQKLICQFVWYVYWNYPWTRYTGMKLLLIKSNLFLEIILYIRSLYQKWLYIIVS